MMLAQHKRLSKVKAVPHLYLPLPDHWLCKLGRTHDLQKWVVEARKGNGEPSESGDMCPNIVTTLLLGGMLRAQLPKSCD